MFKIAVGANGWILIKFCVIADINNICFGSVKETSLRAQNLCLIEKKTDFLFGGYIHLRLPPYKTNYCTMTISIR